MRGFGLAVAMLVGCSPQAGGDGEASGSASEDGTGSTTADASSSSSDATTQSSSSESSGGAAATLCLVRTPLPELVGEAFVPADVDGDGAIELWRIVEDAGTTQLTGFAFDSDRESTPLAPLVRAGAPLALADVDGDGRDDLLTRGEGTAAWYAGTADATFAESSSPLVLPSEGMLQWLDGDGDGVLDAFGTAATAEPGVGAVTIWRGDGAGGFVQGGAIALDVEQALTAVFETPVAGVVAVAHSTGSIGFGPSEALQMVAVDASGALDELPTPAAVYWSWVGAADFDGNGELDVVLRQSEDGGDRQVELWLGDGDGYTGVELGPGPTAAYLGAFTGAGPLVLAPTDGLRLFAGAQDAGAGVAVDGELPPLTAAVVLDLDGDGRDELFEQNHSELESTWAIVDVLPCE